MKSQRHLITNLLKALLLGLCAFALVGCSSDQSTDTHNPTDHHTEVDPISCDSLPYHTVNGRLEAGMNMAYGTVESVEPVLDEFITPGAGDTTVRNKCDGRIQPAIEVHIRVQNASWDHTDALTIRVEPEALHHSAFQPSLDGSNTLQWQKDPAFLTSGQTLAVGGSLVDKSHIATKLTGLYPVDNGQITIDFGADNRCMDDDFVGREVQDLIQRIQKAGEAQEPTDMSDALYLFSSSCVEGE